MPRRPRVFRGTANETIRLKEQLDLKERECAEQGQAKVDLELQLSNYEMYAGQLTEKTDELQRSHERLQEIIRQKEVMTNLTR
jgi:hypothetical protein